MSEENVAVVRAVYEAFGRGDVPAVLGAFAEDIEWDEAKGLPYGGVYHGPQAVAENVFGPITNDIEGFAATPSEFYSGGNEVVSIGAYTGAGAATGKPLDVAFVHAWTVRDGKIARFRQFVDATQFNAVLPSGAAA